MNDEIKEILGEIYNIQLGYMKPVYKRDYSNKDYVIESYENLVFRMKNCITNLQEDYEKEHYLVDKLTRQLNDEYKNTEYQCKQKEIYKSRNEKAIEDIDLVIELIKQQPTEDDSWILNELNGFKYLLNGGDE